MADRIDGDLVERALALLDVTPGCVCDHCQNAPRHIQSIIAEARQREREACAEIAESFQCAYAPDAVSYECGNALADAIRARASQEDDPNG